jgi:hypothetical protein
MSDRAVTTLSIYNNATSVAPLSLNLVLGGTIYRGVPVIGLFLDAKGGVGPYTITTTGAPAGLAFDAHTGLGSGTPTTIGHVIFTATVTDTIGPPVTFNFAIDVKSRLSVVALPTSVADIGVAYSSKIKIAGNTGALTFTTSTLSGIALSAAGLLTGTATAAGRLVFSTTATDAGTGDTLAIQFAIVVGDVISIHVEGEIGGVGGPYLPSAGIVGRYLRIDLDIEGGTPPYDVSFAVIHDAVEIDTGLKVDPSGTYIDGIIAAGSESPGGIDWTYAFEIAVTDSLGMQYSDLLVPTIHYKTYTWWVVLSDVGAQQDGADSGSGFSKINYSFPSFGSPSASVGNGVLEVQIPITVTEIDAPAPFTVAQSGSVWTISMPQVTTAADGWLSHTDWNTFNAKLADAPNNTNTYGRKGAAWVAIPSTLAWGAITGILSSQTDLQTALNAKAPLASPTFTGAPAAPNPAAGTNTTQLATTAFVVSGFATINSPTFTGVPAGPTAAAGTNTTQFATTAYVVTALGSYATLASPTFTGTVTVPTPSAGSNTTVAATTAWVRTFVSGAGGVSSVAAGAGMSFSTITGSGTVTMGAPSTLTATTTNSASGTTHTHAITGFAALSGATFTGAISAPTVTDSSDASFKSDIRDLQECMATVRALMPRRFFNKQTELDDFGFIAQEVREVVPEIVATNDDGYLTLAYQRLVAPIIGSLHEIDARLKRLESKR